MNKSIDDTLNDRGSRYGDFEGHADITQSLKRVMQEAPNWPALADDQREALDMVAHKIGRILNGDPDYLDSWHDIIGYVRLVEQRLERRGTPPWPKEPASAEDDEAFEREFDEIMRRQGAENEAEQAQEVANAAFERRFQGIVQAAEDIAALRRSVEDDEAFEREFEGMMRLGQQGMDRGQARRAGDPHGPLHPFSGSTDEAVKRSVERRSGKHYDLR